MTGVPQRKRGGAFWRLQVAGSTPAASHLNGENMEKTSQLKAAVCKCGESSWGCGKSTRIVSCMHCDEPWDGDPSTYPNGSSVSYHRYPEWYAINEATDSPG